MTQTSLDARTPPDTPQDTPQAAVSAAAPVVVVRPGIVFWTLAAVIVLLVVLHLGVRGCDRVAFCAPLVPFTRSYGYLFDLSIELNIPTWFAIMQIGLVAIALAFVALVERAAGRPTHRWWTLAALFAYLSLDEGTDLHGLWLKATPNLTLLDEPSTFDWVFAGAVVVAVVALYFLPWVLRLPRRTRNLFILAGAIFVSGALGMEILGAYVGRDGNWHGLAYGLVSTAEEALEKFGILVMLYAVLSHLAGQRFQVDIVR